MSQSISGESAYGVMFHHFHGGIHPTGQGSISDQDFVDLIEFLGPARFLSAPEWQERAMDGTLEPHHLCLTFDDGLLCQYDIAMTVMNDYRLTAFWFVYSSVTQGGIEVLEIYHKFRNSFFDNVDNFYDVFFEKAEEMYEELYRAGLSSFDEDTYLAQYKFYSTDDRKFRYLRDHALKPNKYNKVMDGMIADCGLSATEIGQDLWLSESHLRELDALDHCIGLHSFTHPTRMEDLSRDDQHLEYAKNYDHLSDLLGKKPVAMSHPCNSYSDETLEILRELGLALGFRANMNPTVPESMLEWPRDDHANIMAQIRQRNED